MVRTPRDLSAAMLARAGTVEGEKVWCLPCRARKAILAPEGSEAIVMGEGGKPQGCGGVSFFFFFDSKRLRGGLGFGQ